MGSIGLPVLSLNRSFSGEERSQKHTLSREKKALYLFLLLLGFLKSLRHKKIFMHPITLLIQGC